MTTELLYFHDPMCSWCWAFRPVWTELCAQLPTGLAVRCVLGGLAPDSEAPMPPEMRQKLKGIWQTIQERVPGTRFNFAFWDDCTPRRSTYNACRAVLAAARFSPAHEERMIHAIQQAYYLQARNPSDISTLMDLAIDIGLDPALFATELTGFGAQTRLDEDIALAHSAPINGFPSLVIRTPSGLHPVALDYLHATPMRQNIQTILDASHAH